MSHLPNKHVEKVLRRRLDALTFTIKTLLLTIKSILQSSLFRQVLVVHMHEHTTMLIITLTHPTVAYSNRLQDSSRFSRHSLGWFYKLADRLEGVSHSSAFL